MKQSLVLSQQSLEVSQAHFTRRRRTPTIELLNSLLFCLTAVNLAATLPQGLPATLAERANLPHGIAGDHGLVFVTEPLNGRVAVLDRFSGDEIGELAPPPGGFLLPFELRIPHPGHLVVLDSGGFPSPTSLAIPRVYDYQYTHNPAKRRFKATLQRTVRFDGIPFLFAEDVEALSDGRYVVSDSGFGALWVIQRDGSITPGLVPRSLAPEDGIPGLAPCVLRATVTIADGVPYELPGGFAPGVGSMTSRGGFLYFGGTCPGGIARVPVASFTDARPPHERAADIEIISPRPEDAEFDTLKGLTFNPWDPRDEDLYAGDPFNLRIVRIDITTGERTVIVEDPVLFNFPVSMRFLPPVRGQYSLVVSSDQEHRFAPLNAALGGTSVLQLPFRIVELRFQRALSRRTGLGNPQ
jgi:hypothetical protein